MGFELVEAPLPHLSIGLEPLVELHQGFGPKAVETALAVHTDRDEAGVSQHPKVLRHCGLTDLEAGDQGIHRPFAGPQLVEDLAPARLGEDLDRGARTHPVSMPSPAYNCQGICRSGRRIGEQQNARPDSRRAGEGESCHVCGRVGEEPLP